MTTGNDQPVILKDKIRDPFTHIPNRFVDAFVYLTPAAVKLWIYLRRKANPKRDGIERAWPSYCTIQRDIGLGRDTIARAVKELATTGWLSRRRRFAGSTIYYLQLGQKVDAAISRKNRLMQSEKPTDVVEKADPNKTKENKIQSTTAAAAQRGAGTTSGAGVDLNETESAVLNALKACKVRVNKRTVQLARAIAPHANVIEEITRIHAELSAHNNVKNLAGLLVDTLSNHDWSASAAPAAALPRAFIEWGD